MVIRLYQLNVDENPELEKQVFRPYFMLERKGIKVNRADYKLVYEYEESSTPSLDSIFTKFNLDRPDDFRGWSLSVSDVICRESGSTKEYMFVDDFGFRPLDWR